MAESVFKLKEITDYITLDKTNVFIDFPLKIMTLLFSFFSLFGFLIIFFYFQEKGITREAFSYIYSFQYLLFISLFSIALSLVVFITFNTTFIFSNIIGGNKYINWNDGVFKNRCNSFLLFSFVLFWVFLYLTMDVIKYFIYFIVLIFPVVYLFFVRNIIIFNDKFIFCCLFIACYCIAILSQIQIFTLILKVAEKNSFEVDSAFILFLVVFVLNIIIYFYLDKLGFKAKFIASLFFVLFLSVILIYIPNRMMNIVGLGDFKSTYIVKSNGVNIYEGLESKVAPKWGDKKSIKLIDIYVVANLPEKIIVSSDEKDHIMYSIPKSLILSEVFGVQPNDKN